MVLRFCWFAGKRRGSFMMSITTSIVVIVVLFHVVLAKTEQETHATLSGLPKDFTPTTAPSCTPSDIPKYQYWDNTTYRWRFAPNTCGFRDMNGADITSFLRGRPVLFLGDSTLRNNIHVMMAETCNEQNLTDCHQTIVYDQKYKNIFLCGHENVKTNKCNRTLRIKFTPLPGLTYYRPPKDARERVMFLRRNIMAPVKTVYTTEGVTIHFLDVSCGDRVIGLPRALKWMIQNPHRMRGIQFEAIVFTSALHCTLGHFAKHWYLFAAEHLRTFNKPIIFMEPPHCFRIVPLKPHSLVPCWYINSYLPILTKVFNTSNFLVAPQRHVTKHAVILNSFQAYLTEQQKRLPCAFYDFRHGAMPCCRAMAQALLQTLRMAWEGWRPQGPVGPWNFSTNFSLSPDDNNSTLAPEGGDTSVAAASNATTPDDVAWPSSPTPRPSWQLLVGYDVPAVPLVPSGLGVLLLVVVLKTVRVVRRL